MNNNNNNANIILKKNCYVDQRGFLYLKIINRINCGQLKFRQLNIYIDTIYNFCKDNPKPILVDARDVFGVISNKDFIYLAKNPKLKKSNSMVAFVVNSLPLKLLIHNYIRIHKPNIPSRVFNSIEKGEDYCINFKDSHGI